ncbi:hypothetical protein Tco_0001269 [Tanacetum coccineum]
MKEEFPAWFGKQIRQRHVNNDPGVNESSELFALDCGPSQTPISVNSCVVNGVRFVMHSRDERRTTQNSGICSPGPDGEMYYDQLEQILEFSYLLFKTVLFRKAWQAAYTARIPNLGLKAITDKSGPVPIRFEVHDRKPTASRRPSFSLGPTTSGRYVRELPMHYPSLRQMSPGAAGEEPECKDWDPVSLRPQHEIRPLASKSITGIPACTCKRSTMTRRLLSKKRYCMHFGISQEPCWAAKNKTNEAKSKYGADGDRTTREYPSLIHTFLLDYITCWRRILRTPNIAPLFVIVRGASSRCPNPGVDSDMSQYRALGAKNPTHIFKRRTPRYRSVQPEYVVQLGVSGCRGMKSQDKDEDSARMRER